eukprot:CAMPEP_0179122682 /NCGR_PEP_ID=MMETSP0796-20121207/57909_1 /TAXON_ID=73915 /ORGANISM="Pyrodinium bahamense, Strain pbaha01" /LENGTH=143 /DNA_ID=CAMNT_0020821307 /DNA_START=559 /DNA_END=990 /DNA_ORIENTATION=+
MLSEYLVLHKCCQGEVVKEVCEVLPCALAVVFSCTLVVKAVDLRDLPALVVPTKDRDPLWETHLEAEQQGDTFHREVATVHVIPQEEVVRVRWETPDAEELHQVMELSMDVPGYCHGTSHRLHVALSRENLFRKIADLPDLCL